MFFEYTVAASVIALVVTSGTYAVSDTFQNAFIWVTVWCLFCGIFLFCATSLSLVVFVQAWLLFFVCMVCAWRKKSAWVFLAWSLLVTLADFGVVGYFAYKRIADVRAQYPSISVEDRVRVPNPAHRIELTKSKHVDWGELSSLLEYKERDIDPKRIESLRTLHARTYYLFASSPGFGVTRMDDPFYNLKFERERGFEDEETGPVPQPGGRYSSEWLDALKPVEADPNFDVSELLTRTIADFANPKDYGFVRDRKLVAGFREHALGWTPPTPPGYDLVSMELLGLVVHDKPVVYVSKHLPRMKEIATTPTRALDEFERLGLKAIQGGDDVFMRDVGPGRRVLGAIRSVGQCVSCHGGQEGDLLGAFSYTLSR